MHESSDIKREVYFESYHEVVIIDARGIATYL